MCHVSVELSLHFVQHDLIDCSLHSLTYVLNIVDMREGSSFELLLCCVVLYEFLIGCIADDTG